VLDQERRRRVLDIISSQLVTPFGLRTLAPNDANYQGQLQASIEEQQRALHQGSVWTWLLGPYVDALLSVEESAIPAETSQDSIVHLEQVWHTGLHLLEAF